MAGQGHKRQFPYWSAVDEIQIKRPGLAGGVNAAHEPSEPKVFQQPAIGYGNRSSSGTDFSSWTQEQIKAFLDQRGGDYDDCKSFAELVDRAHETEANTGPASKPAQQDDADEEEVDPLEAFMAEINQEVKEDRPVARAKQQAELACDEEADPAAEFLAARKAGGSGNMAVAAAMAASGYNSDDEVYATANALDKGAEMDYDSDDNAVVDKKKHVEAMAALDHSSMEYDDFAKDFYEPHPEIVAMSDGDVNTLRRHLDVRASGFDPPRPVTKFAHCGFDAQLLAAIKKAGYEKPTAIQAQALPAVLSGRDVLGIAKTGSGKTAAFTLPMMVHVMDQKELGKGEGPIGVVVAPTRELAEQIHKEARKFGRPYSLRVAAAFGGLSKFEQFKDLKAGAEVAVATPGRLLDLIKMKACTMRRATYLVLDEADRMFDMGFEYQVRSIVGQIRPDRQTLLFSATMPRRVERLVGDILTSPVRIAVGQVGAANEDVRQDVEVVASEDVKQAWLAARVQSMIDDGDVLVFAGQKARVESLVEFLKGLGVKAAGIHGDMDQYSRMAVLEGFREGAHHVLVATDVAARGLDIKSIRTVVNFDAAKDIETHIHRVGRTGRAGDKDGTAITLLTPKQAWFAGQLVQSLALAGQPVPPHLHDLALKDTQYRKGNSRSKGGRGGGRKKPQVGGAGLGFGGGGGGGVGGGAGGGGTMQGFQKSSQQYEAEDSAAAGPSGAGSGGAGSASTSGSAEQQQQRGGGAEVYRNFYTKNFKNAFVSSGTTGGDIGATATIMAPKLAPSRPSGPAPTPVTHQPQYAPAFPQFPRPSAPRATPSTSYHNQPPPASLNSLPASGPRRSSTEYAASYKNMPPPPSVMAPPESHPPAPGAPQTAAQSAAVAQAIAAAQAVAARLMQQSAPGAPTPQAQPPQQQQQWLPPPPPLPPSFQQPQPPQQQQPEGQPRSRRARGGWDAK